MKNKATNSKKTFLNKFFIKLIRKFGYEVIDQANLYIPLKNLKANENLSESGKQSISIPLGKTEITRKVKSLTKGKATDSQGNKPTNAVSFGGQHTELWCVGGELRFVRDMIKESAAFDLQ